MKTARFIITCIARALACIARLGIAETVLVTIVKDTGRKLSPERLATYIINELYIYIGYTHDHQLVSLHQLYHTTVIYMLRL